MLLLIIIIVSFFTAALITGFILFHIKMQTGKRIPKPVGRVMLLIMFMFIFTILTPEKQSETDWRKHYIQQGY